MRCLLEKKLPHLLFGNTSDILSILAELRASGIGACLDTGHASLSGDLHNLILGFNDRLCMLHAHDNHGRGDDHLPPGDGILDWQMIVASLDEVGFRGPIILEIQSASSIPQTLENARRGLSFLQHTLANRWAGCGNP